MNIQSLHLLGWSNFFLQQVDFDQLEQLYNGHSAFFRISAIHRTVIKGLGESWRAGEQELLCPDTFQPISEHFAVGDWVIAEKAHEHYRITHLLAAKNQIERLNNQRRQIISANIDYLFIVTSANEDFNLKRLERYLAMSYECYIEPVIVLNKIDLCQDKEHFLEQIQALNVNEIVAISVYQPDSLTQLTHFLQPATTTAMVGSSGVGKSSLINALFQVNSTTEQRLLTGEIRKDDDKGKHTTTSRQLLVHEKSGLFIDTPGMRELQLLGASVGIDQTFNDIVLLAKECKFTNCTHENEPHCRIRQALEAREIESFHLDNYRKLLREDAFNARSAQGAYAQKQHMKTFSKHVKSAISSKQKRDGKR